MTTNATIFERGQLIAGMFLTNFGKLDVIAKPHAAARRPARHLVRRRRRPVRVARALRAAA